MTDKPLTVANTHRGRWLMDDQKLHATKGKTCGSERYQIQPLYNGYRQRVFVVVCEECQDPLIPVVVDHSMPEVEVYKTCATAWNDANKIPLDADTETPLERAFSEQPQTGIVDAALKRIGDDH